MTRKLLIWIGTVIGSSILTLLVADWWQAARGTVEIAKVEIRSPGQPTDKLVLGDELAQKTRDHIYFNTLNSESTFEKVEKALDDARRKADLANRTGHLIESLIKLLQTQSAALSLETRRKEFLITFTAKSEESDWFEKIAKGLLVDYETNLPKKYSSHPPGTENLNISLETMTYQLGQENEEEFARRVEGQVKNVNAYAIARQEAHVNNIWRRLFVYYEPEVLLGFLTSSQSRIEVFTKRAEEIIAAVTAKIEQTRKQHLYVSLLVSNSGDTPLPVQPIGVLRLRVPSVNKQGSQAVQIRLGATLLSSQTTIVEKGKPGLLTLMSQKPLSKIIEENHDLLGGEQWTPDSSVSNSRFMQLWQAKTAGLEASAKLARASLDPNKTVLAESPVHPISLSSDVMVYEQLEK
jgi:hypothetical protein